jgi:hypothetical protein
MKSQIAMTALLHVLWLALLAMPAASVRANPEDECLQKVQNGPPGTVFTCVGTRRQFRGQAVFPPVGKYVGWTKAIWQDQKRTCPGTRDPSLVAICDESEAFRQKCAASTPFDATPAQRRVCHMTGEWSGSADRSMELAAYMLDHQEAALACANIIKFERVNVFESLDKRAAALDARSATALRESLRDIARNRHDANIGVIKESLKSLEPAGSELLASYLGSDQSWRGRIKEFIKNISGAGQGPFKNCLLRHWDDQSFCNSLQTSATIASIQRDVATLQAAADAVLGTFTQCSKLTADVVTFLQADAPFPADQPEKPVIFEGAVDKAKERMNASRGTPRPGR